MDLDKLVRETLLDTGSSMNPLGFVIAIAAALAASFAIALLYQIFYENRATGSQIHRAFPILGPSITTLFICIQFSLPLSLGLLGALSFVRFRTPIKEPEEIGFLMVLVGASIAIATFQFVVLILFLAGIVAALLIGKYVPRLRRSNRREGQVLISVPEEQFAGVSKHILAALRSRLSVCQVESVTNVEGVTSVNYSFCGLAEDDFADLTQELQTLESVQRVSIFFNRSGVLI